MDFNIRICLGIVSQVRYSHEVKTYSMLVSATFSPKLRSLCVHICIYFNFPNLMTEYWRYKTENVFPKRISNYKRSRQLSDNSLQCKSYVGCIYAYSHTSHEPERNPLWTNPTIIFICAFLELGRCCCVGGNISEFMVCITQDIAIGIWKRLFGLISWIYLLAIYELGVAIYSINFF